MKPIGAFLHSAILPRLFRPRFLGFSRGHPKLILFPILAARLLACISFFNRPPFPQKDESGCPSGRDSLRGLHFSAVLFVTARLGKGETVAALISTVTCTIRWFRCAASVACLSAFSLVRGAEDLSQWAHSSDLYFDTSPAGANVANRVLDFPVLVRLRSPDFDFSQAMGKGEDIRFSKPDGAPINYEIERWDPVAKAAEIWLRLDTVPGAYQGRLARMHWGKPGSASLSSAAGVFSAANAYESVWHMGGAGSGPRANAVTGKPPASPGNFEGDESGEGVIGLADNLDGGAPGDYLNIGNGYAQFPNGFTFSIWAHPTRNSKWGRLLDMGNGPGMDNIYLMRKFDSQDLVFGLWQGGTKTAGEITANGILYPDQWGWYAVTVSGKSVRIYRNGALAASGDLPVGINNAVRTKSYLGRSNWASDEYFAGAFDEAEIANVARSADWIKLAYANQNPRQNLVSFTPPSAYCAEPKFSAPSDTSLPEESVVELVGIAECAKSFLWSALSGPAPRILDPEVKVLLVSLPRVGKDTSIVYRFSADYGVSAQAGNVQIRIKKSIPDPVFTLGAAAWNGKDSLVLKPVISNLDEIRASREPNISYAWTVAGLNADTAWRADGLLLKSAYAEGDLNVGLCLSNNGAPVCKTVLVNVKYATTSLGGKKPPIGGESTHGALQATPGHDAQGRFISASKSRTEFPAGRFF